MGFDSGKVLYVKSDGGWLVGTANGELIHFDEKGEELWSHSVGTGLIRGIAVSRDEKVVYAGEKSPEGTMYAMDVKNGDVLWTFRGDSLIGYEADIQSEPTAIDISTDAAGHVYAVFYRFTLDEKGQRTYLSRIISFDEKLRAPLSRQTRRRRRPAHRQRPLRLCDSELRQGKDRWSYL